MEKKCSAMLLFGGTQLLDSKHTLAQIMKLVK